MSRLILLFVLLACSAASPAFAGKRPNDFSTAGFAAKPGPRSPVVHADGTIDFALRFPSAHEVVVNFGEWSARKVALAKNADGCWTGRIGPVAPGLYAYIFLVDGTPVIDPLNPQLKAGTVVYSSMVDVPGAAPRYDAIQDVPQGALHVLRYRSASQNRWQTLHVHLPAAYAREPSRRFPVLYLRHGGGDDDHSWMQDGRAGVILDNLLAAGSTEPMIIVTTNGMTDGTWSHGSSVEGIKLLEDELLHDVVPLIEQSYRVLPDREHRALAGLSMGGGQAFVIGLRHPETFAWIAQFSSGLLADKDLDLLAWAPALRDAKKVNASLRLLWIGCGTDDTRYAGHLNLTDALTDLGVRAEFHASPGGHEWPVWRDQLHALLPVLFHAPVGVRP
jgi:enterochelin esterase-like enzyme